MNESNIIVAIISGGFSLLAALAVYLGTRGKTRADSRAALDARIDARMSGELTRVYDRLDAVEKLAVRRASAFARILRQIANQWTGDPRGPHLDPADIREVEDTIPPQWIRRHSPSKEKP